MKLSFESTGARLGAARQRTRTELDGGGHASHCRGDKADIVTKGFTAPADFAGGTEASFPREVEKERGGVRSREWRGQPGAGSRISDKQLPSASLQLAICGAPAHRLKPDIIRPRRPSACVPFSTPAVTP